MKMKITSLLYAFVFLCTIGIQSLHAQVNESTITADQASFEMIAPNSYLMEVTGPNNYFFKQEIANTKSISISNVDANGKKFADGPYLMQITPIITLTEKERQEIAEIRAENDYEKMTAFRAEHRLPNSVDVTNVYFTIRDGEFVNSNQKEIRGLSIPKMFNAQQQDHPGLYASLNSISTNYEKPIVGNKGLAHTTDNTSVSEDAQVFTQDVVVQGSICVGFDCATSESFGFDTERIKENNLRIHFDDTSASASFPGNDWRITINDSSNGGANYFAIEDATAGRIPFRIEAGAPVNSLYVDDAGNIGIGTATPVVEAHITDGDSPTLRLEQNGSSGFGSQTWDIAGNETNFFIRDVTNGSLLSFRIRPKAPKNSIYIDTDGDIGLGTESPVASLQVESGDVYMKSGFLGINKVATSALDMIGTLKVQGTSIFTGDISAFTSDGATFFGDGNAPILRVDGENLFVGIGTAEPGHLLELDTDDAVKPNGGSWSAPSDRRLKTNIRDFNEGLNQILQVRPVKYNYNGKLGYPTDTEFIGVIAQEMQEIAPYTIKDLNHNREGENYLAFDPSALTYLLINAVQEQQEMINVQQKEIAELEDQLAKINDLKAQVEALSQMVSSIKESNNSSDEAVGEKK